jgi:predicted phosphodiesterase
MLYDVHGNLPALEAVLSDARAAGAERFVLGGDYALFGAFPAETLNALRGLVQAAWIRGNVDRWCAHPDQAPDQELFKGAIPACRKALGEELVRELDALPESLTVDATLYCHASPVSDVRPFAPQADDSDAELLAGVSERRVVFGHTHLQFRRTGRDGIELVNPGSVGAPWDGDHRAAYALLDDDGSIDLRRVDYDHESSITALHERYGDEAWVQQLAERLRRARFV